jgi:N-acetylglucosamine-6-phosphate deacetylase
VPDAAPIAQTAAHGSPQDQAWLFHGGHVVLPNRTLQRADLLVQDGRIASISEDHGGDRPIERVHTTTAEHIDATGLVVSPGFVDLQCNGAVGIDLASNPEQIASFAAALPRWGVTSVLPTIITSTPQIVSRALDAIESLNFSAAQARVLGLHLEGPFLHPEFVGAHPPQWLVAPDAQNTTHRTQRWHNPSVALVTLAPELPGAADLVQTLRSRGVKVFAGHSAATADQLAAACEAGVSGVTHLFNAMRALHHRQPGIPGAVLGGQLRTHEGAGVVASLIVDGVHVDPSVVALTWRCLDDRLILVSDAVAALGMMPGIVQLGDVRLRVSDSDVRLSNGTLAGSILSMDTAVRNLMSFAGATLAEAVYAAATAPAAAIGRTDLGRIEVGAAADLVVLNPAGDVVDTWINGVRYEPRP